MNDDPRLDDFGFPQICNARGGPSADGHDLLVEGLTADGHAVRFAVPLDEVKHLVAFLLVAVGKVTAFQKDNALPAIEPQTGQTDRCRPIPATAIGIGEPEDDQGYLMITVGCADLLFQVPISAFEPVARSMLLASVQPSDQPS